MYSMISTKHKRENNYVVDFGTPPPPLIGTSFVTHGGGSPHSSPTTATKKKYPVLDPCSTDGNSIQSVLWVHRFRRSLLP